MYKYLFLFSIGFLFFQSCGDEESVYIPDVSGIKLDNKWVRMDQILASLDTNAVQQEFDTLYKKYPDFFDVYFKHILPFDVRNEDEFYDHLHGYLTHEQIRNLQDTTALIFSDLEENTKPELQKGFKFLKYYFPSFNAPNIYTYTSEYTYQQFFFVDQDKDAVGIGLDLFLGKNFPYKSLDPTNPAFSEYLTRTYDKEYIPKKVLEAIIQEKIGPSPGSQLLDYMITNGKKLYVLKRVLPETPDSIIMEYTAEQMDWVKNNEKQIWAFFFDKDLFYESKTIMINKYINPSPDSPGMPSSAPGRTANYIGWQIVESYMKKNPDLTMEQLINNENTQNIMDKSRYKPRR